MPEYIDRKQIRYTWWQKKDGTYTDGVTLQSIIEDMPTADVAEVKHGEWEEVKYIEGCLNSYKHTCSCCGKSYFDNNSNNYPFCPLCGAKMDGVSNG